MIDAKTCALWARSSRYKSRVNRTRDSIADMLLVARKPYIAFSCGKDSSVMADMILRQNPAIPLRFVSRGETRLMHNVDAVLEYFRSAYDANIEEILFDRVFSEEWKDASFAAQQEAGKRDIRDIDNTGYDAVFMGLRIQESRKRSITLRYHRTEGLPDGTYRYKGREFYRFCPLAQWRTEDVGAYLTEHNIPVLDWYRDFGFEGRTTSRLNDEALKQNTLFWLRQNNPDGYQKLVTRFPELRIY